jgi:branched-chain amino acid aminotransferase
MPSKRAQALGCSQVLWLFGEDRQITEVGAMNMFFVIRKRGSDEIELITAPLDRGDILPGMLINSICHVFPPNGECVPGVTRDSVLALARAGGKLTVSERWIRISDVQEAANENRVRSILNSDPSIIAYI